MTTIGTLAERQPVYMMLLHLPDRYAAEQVRGDHHPDEGTAPHTHFGR